MHDGIGRGVAQHLARVVFAEVDGLGGVGLRFGERFAGFQNQPRVEFRFSRPQNCGCFDENFDAPLDRREGPFAEIGVGVFDGEAGLIGVGLGVPADNFGRLRRVDGDEPLPGPNGPPRNPVIVIATGFAADGGDGFLLTPPVRGLGEIGIRFDGVCRKRRRGHGLAFDDLAAALQHVGGIVGHGLAFAVKFASTVHKFATAVAEKVTAFVRPIEQLRPGLFSAGGSVEQRDGRPDGRPGQEPHYFVATFLCHVVSPDFSMPPGSGCKER